MVRGDSQLRAELSRLTNPATDAVGVNRVEKWLEDLIEEISELKERHSHSISIYTLWTPELSTTNCYMYALDLSPKDIQEWRYLGIQPNTAFVSYLLKDVLVGKDIIEAVQGDVLIYFDDTGRPRHAGKFIDGKVISKWGNGCTHIWTHELWEVPIDYGSVMRIFQPLPQQEAVAAYIEWAKSQW